jgi:micrococcal nuclease
MPAMVLRTWGRLALAAVVLLAAPPADAGHRRLGPRRPPARPPSAVVLDGSPVAVRWIDGDTFRFLDGPRQGQGARLEGYNTLETYGPVHRWGGWTRRELLALARAATPLVASRTWSCHSAGAQDRYRRLLVACPDAAAELVRAGLAMVFAIGVPPQAGLLDLQRDAQRRGAGMWAKGVPGHILTSVHSADEAAGTRPHDRLVDTATGVAGRRQHDRSYGTCDEVCAGAGADRSCMLYVPFARRFRGPPRCLRE